MQPTRGRGPGPALEPLSALTAATTEDDKFLAISSFQPINLLQSRLIPRKEDISAIPGFPARGFFRFFIPLRKRRPKVPSMTQSTFGQCGNPGEEILRLEHSAPK